MLVLGFELQDILRAVVGVALGILTVYRRELSSNRAYHPNETQQREDESSNYICISDDGRSSSDNSSFADTTPRSRIRRRKSSSAISSMTESSSNDMQHNNNDTHHNNSSRRSQQHNEDPTEELLESAGLILSGGPFLAVAIAIFDHLISCMVITTYIVFTSITSLLHKMRTKSTVTNFSATPHGMASEEETLEQLLPESRKDEHQKEQHQLLMSLQNQEHIYSVAWNAANEYFTRIAEKIDNSPIKSPNSIGNDSIGISTNTAEMMISRSKSMNNLQQHSEEGHALFREMLAMANNGSMDVCLLPSDAQVEIFSYLSPKDLLSFTCTNKAGRSLLDDSDSEELSNSDDGLGEKKKKNSDTPMLIWKALFLRDFSWVLSDWDIGKEAVMRSISILSVQESSGSRVFRHLVSSLIVSEEHSKSLPAVADVDNIAETTTTSSSSSSMKEFYFTFAETWLNYTIAGCNATDKCLIGLHGHVFNISDFVEDHPGSTETLLLQAGRDATVFFESMGHSLKVRVSIVLSCECLSISW